MRPLERSGRFFYATILRMITIFTDGSSRGNPGPGGWGAVVIAEGKKQRSKEAKEAQLEVTELGGAEDPTTNNRMELKAAIEGLKSAKKDSVVTVHSDSSYVINGITKWVKGWQRKDWKTMQKKDVENRDLWEELIEAVEGRSVSWKYVGGHVGILGNERCDHIATAFADGRKIPLYKGPLNAYDLPDILDISLDEEKSTKKSSSSSRSRAAAFSYVSSVGGIIETHKTWAECEKRVKGAKGARYKKALTAADEAVIMGEFSAL